MYESEVERGATPRGPCPEAVIGPPCGAAAQLDPLQRPELFWFGRFA
jgi:hypothetical protein